MKTKYNIVFYIEDKQNAVMLHLISQSYLLLFERTSPVITPTSQDISEDNFEQITLSQLASCNLQSPRDTVLTQTQLQSPTDTVLTPRQLELQQQKFKL